MNMEELIEDVERARHNFIVTCSGLTYEEVCFKPTPESWSITQIADEQLGNR